ncbi:MAG: type II/IV secretion system protein, partial [Planctomycetes bacterium]|nr:type II/IV secretion system protein [Planctomycetota bacterium]
PPGAAPPAAAAPAPEQATGPQASHWGEHAQAPPATAPAAPPPSPAPLDEHAETPSPDEAWSLEKTPSTGFRTLRRPNETRRVLAGMLRTLLHRKELSREDLKPVLAGTLQKADEEVHASAVLAVLCSPRHQEGEVLSVHLAGPGGDGGAHLAGHKLFLYPDGLLAQIVRRRKPFLHSDPRGIRALPPELTRALGSPVFSLLAVPVRINRNKSAVLLALNKYPDPRELFDPDDLDLLKHVADSSKRAIQRALGLQVPFNESERAWYASLLSGCPFQHPEEPCPVDRELLQTIPRAVFEQFSVLPVRRLAPTEMAGVVVDPSDFKALSDFESVSGFRLTQKRVGTPTWIAAQLEQAYEHPDKPLFLDPIQDLAADLRRIYELGSDVERRREVYESSPPIVRLANHLIEDAHKEGASDIHVEARDARCLIRYRIDGVCRERIELPSAALRPLVARLKIMSDLDIAEHRLPQDGRLSFREFNPAVDVDLRVSVMPMQHGECVVMRLLDKHRSTLPLDQLGYSPHALETYRGLITSPYGMVLHCGPTGSGKSMSLYAALNEVKSPEWKVVTAEDPIEYTLEGVNQLQVHSEIGLTFAAALRCFLRHDPDVILVGEIRDPETARMAVEASLTGHLLLSTLHTNDAASSLPRLERLGIEPFLVATTVLGLCAQRLVRRLCGCKVLREPDPAELDYLRRAKGGVAPGQIGVPSGCERCSESGYKGRVGIYEVMSMSGELRQRISTGCSTVELKSVARRQGMRTLFEDAMEKVNAGVTSLHEAFRVACPDEEL